MEPVVFMPTMLAGHVAKYCNHMVNSPDENNNIGGVYSVTTWKFFDFCVNERGNVHVSLSFQH